MPQLDDMRLFLGAVKAGSLSAAGRALGCSPALASKRLSRLEQDLGVRLMHRSSRQLTLTEEGQIYAERCELILAEVDEAEAAIGPGRREPRGLLKVSSPVALGRRWVGPALAQFAKDFPLVQVQLSLNDQVVDLLEAGIDCAVRMGASPDSSLVSRPLADNRRVLCAAPDYVLRRGAPRHPNELVAHDCILMARTPQSAQRWDFWARGGSAATAAERLSVAPPARFLTDNGEQAHDWALAGLGIMRRSYWDVAAELRDGRLVELLADWQGESAPIQVIFPSRRLLPARTRLFIDRLVALFGAAA